jgi:hypothetical protein
MLKMSHFKYWSNTMSNVSATGNKTDTSTQTSADVTAAAANMSKVLENDQSLLLSAYNLKDGDAGVADLARQLGLTGNNLTNATAKGLQMIAEQRFQQSSQRITLFSNLMERLAQMKQQLIQNLRN